jgi:uncharacterized protein (TIGR02996 family)
VTEDEAFIRAIVDSPGDDIPRLIYADWLDDRDDSRGPYLRAEAEWAKRKCGGPRSKSFAEKFRVEKRLRRTGAKLDALWVARVGRPPVGVCCDNARFTERGPVLRTADIDHVERRLGGEFSADFRAFLLNYNGGTPVPACLPYADPGWADMDMEIGKFNVASRPGEVPPEGVVDPQWWGFGIECERDFLEGLYQNGGGEGPNPLIADMVPFADTLHDLGELLIGIGKTNRGRVYHFRDYCHNSNDPNYLFNYTITFAEFLTYLRPRRDS